MSDPKNKHYSRSSDESRHVIIGNDNDPNHGHIVYNSDGDVDYIRGQGTDRSTPEYDTNRGDNVDHPSWPWPQGSPPDDND